MVVQPLLSIFPALDAVLQQRVNGSSSSASSTGSGGTQQWPSQSSLVGVTGTNSIASGFAYGADSGQVSQVSVNSLGGTGIDIVNGQILSSASAAKLTLVGASGGVVASDGQYVLTGSRGQASLSLNAGESLAAVANAINQASSQIGVSATVDGNNLILSSNDVGSSAWLSLAPVDWASQSVQGLNSSQVNSLNTVSQTPGTTDTISGTVTSSVQGAQLVYEGTTGATAAGSASFTLTGSRGSANVTLTQGESLSAVAGRINQATSSTGVIAVVSNNNLLLTSDTIGASALVQINSVQQSTGITTTGVNSSQVSSVSVSSLNSGATEVISGNVVHSATAADVTLQGSSNSTVIDSATFNLTGSSGSTQFSITQGESLSAVAARINAQTDNTGVVAQVNSNQLVFQSVGVGSAANVNVQLTNITHTNVVTGVDSQQVSGFTVNSLTTGASDTLAGTVDQTASQASLTLQGSAQGTVIDTATFQLTGSLGSANLSVTQGQALSSVAAQVNALTSSTGVVASVVGTNLQFQSADVGSAASVAVQLQSIAYTNSVSGINTQQLSDFTINSLTHGASETFNGQVTRAAATAEVSLQGASDGTVVDTNTFNVTGATGTAQLSIQKGQSLSSVVTQVNALTNSTGVVAHVSGTQVVFDSVNVGSSQSVALTLANVTHATTVSGVNSQQLSSFAVDSFTTGASQTLSGSITKTATNATVTYLGSAGKVLQNSTFTLTGSSGSAAISLTSGQTLSTAADQINAVSSTTGVQASVSGNTLTFQSVGLGSNATIGVNKTSGTFSVNGGNANGTANGTNAQAVINGQTINGTGNSFEYTDSKGTYSFSTVAGYTGALSSIAINQVDQLTGSTYTTTVSGVNSQQLTNVQASTSALGNTQTLSGSVTQTATNAQLTFASALGLIGSSSTFTLTGSLGSSTFSTTALESISTLASQINAVTSTTGVQAVQSGFNLNLVSTGVGSQASVAVKVTSGTFNVSGGSGNGTAAGTNAQAVINGQTLTGNGNAFVFSDSKGTYSFNTVSGYTGAISTVTVGQSVQKTNSAYTTTTSGVSGSQVSDFHTDTFTNGASQTISGTISKAGTSAQLTFAGNFGGNVHTVATFTLSGSLGSSSFTTTNGESLTTLASQVNAVSASTGVQAVVSGNNVNFISTGVGSGATIGVAVTSGTFAVTGGYSSTAARGTDAIATLNGQTLIGNGNTFTFSDAVGSYSLTSASGYTGAINTISLGSSVGQFSVTGGNGNGTASGVDAQAVVNGQTLTGNGNAFQFSDTLGSYSFHTVQGFTGTLSPISVSSQAGQFNVTGGNGNSTANGTDAHATINGQSITGVGNAFHFSDSVGSYSFNTVAGFTGTLHPIDVQSQAGQFSLSGGNGNGSATGTDAVAVINGTQRTGVGNAFSLSDSKGSYRVQFATGFSGNFDPITIQSQTGDFSLAGGNGNGVSHGSNFSATINGVQYSGTSNTVTVTGAHGTYTLGFVNGFVGNIDPITISNSANHNTILGGTGGTAYGTDAIAVINGNIQTGHGSTFTIDQNGTKATVTFVDGFKGTFAPIVLSQYSGQSATTTAPAPTKVKPQSTTLNAAAALKLVQAQINQQYIVNALNQVATTNRKAIESQPTDSSPQQPTDSPDSQKKKTSTSDQTTTSQVPSYYQQKKTTSNHPGSHVNYQS